MSGGYKISNAENISSKLQCVQSLEGRSYNKMVNEFSRKILYTHFSLFPVSIVFKLRDS